MARKKKCYLCDKEKPNGRQYITTSLPASTMRINGLQLCKEHGKLLHDAIWEVIIRFLRCEYIREPKIVFKKEGKDWVATLDDEDNKTK